MTTLAIPPATRRYGPLAAAVLPTPAAPTSPAPAVRRWAAELGEAVQSVAWLPDHSAVLALTVSGRLVRLNGADGQPVWGDAAPTRGVLCFGACPVGPVVATGHLDGQLRLRNTHTGRIVSEQHLGQAWVEHVRWSPDGRWLAAAGGRGLHLLDESGRLLASHRVPAGNIDALRWHPTAPTLAVGCGTTVELLRVSAGPAPGGPASLMPPQTLATARPAEQLAWCPTGRHLVAGHRNGPLSSWLLPEALASQRQAPGRRTGEPCLSWHGSGRWLATAHGPDVAVWEADAAGLAKRPRLLPHHAGPVHELAFQHRGPLLASADAHGSLALWNLLRQHVPLSTHDLGSAASALHWMANDCCLAVGTAGGRVAVLSVVG